MVRLVSGTVLVVGVVAAIVFLPPVALRVLGCVVAALAAREYLEMIDSPIRAVVLAVGACWAWSGVDVPPAHVLALMSLLWVAAELLISGHTIQQATAGLFGAVYVGMPIGMVVAVQALQGWRATLLLIGTIAVSDSAQYYSGRLFGRRPLAPAISPKKTVEGAVGGVVCATAFIILGGSAVLPAASVQELLLLGVLVVTLGICGDLFESRLKRVAGIKDSSSLIPGHGGVLDRIDALLFAAGPFYLYVRNIS